MSKHSVYSKCVYVALGIQDTERLRRILLPSVVCLAIPLYCTLSQRRHDFRKEVLKIKVCCGFLHNSAKNPSHFKKN
jgi:putative effector of murein hydrolase